MQQIQHLSNGYLAEERQDFNLDELNKLVGNHDCSNSAFNKSSKFYNISKQQKVYRGRAIVNKIQENLQYVVWDMFNYVELSCQKTIPAGCYIHLYTGEDGGRVQFNEEKKSILPNKYSILSTSEPLNLTMFQPKNINSKGIGIFLTSELDDEISEQVRLNLPKQGFSTLQKQLPTTIKASLELLFNSSWKQPMARLYSDGITMQSVAQLLNSQNIISSLPIRDINKLESIHELLRQHPQQDYSISQLAIEACMSPSLLQRKFKLYFGVTIFQYLKNLRMDIAATRLDQGCSVQQAAEFVGYLYPENFSLAFKKHFGYNPKTQRLIG